MHTSRYRGCDLSLSSHSPTALLIGFVCYCGIFYILSSILLMCYCHCLNMIQ